jgi:hypothetical protein
MPQQPDWMELIKPNPNYEEIDESISNMMTVVQNMTGV